MRSCIELRLKEETEKLNVQVRKYEVVHYARFLVLPLSTQLWPQSPSHIQSSFLPHSFFDGLQGLAQILL